MKPWPALLTQMYPLPADALVDRPWWMHDENEWYRRLDGQIDREMCTHNIDRLKPLPFPGLRVGQTWAIVTEAGAAVFTITEYDAEHVEVDGSRLPRGAHLRADVDPRVLVPRYNDPIISRPWHAGGSWITDAELLALCTDGYLLADVVCPHLAPWAGMAPPCEMCEGTGTPKPGNVGKPGKDGAWVCAVCTGTGVRA